VRISADKFEENFQIHSDDAHERSVVYREFPAFCRHL